VLDPGPAEGWRRTRRIRTCKSRKNAQRRPTGAWAAELFLCQEATNGNPFRAEDEARRESAGAHAPEPPCELKPGNLADTEGPSAGETTLPGFPDESRELCTGR